MAAAVPLTDIQTDNRRYLIIIRRRRAAAGWRLCNVSNLIPWDFREAWNAARKEDRDDSRRVIIQRGLFYSCMGVWGWVIFFLVMKMRCFVIFV